MTAPLDAVVMGYASLDSLITVSHLPAAGTTAIVQGNLDERPHWGGCGPNVAVGLCRLGLRTGLVSTLGTDALSRRYRRWLRAQGVDASGLAMVADATAPRALMLSAADGASCCLFAPGAGSTPGDDRAQARLLRRARRLVLTVGPTVLTERLVRLALNRAVEIAWGVKADAAAYPADLVRTLAPACEVVVLNAAELAFLGSHLGLASAADLCRLGVRVVVLTRGADGCDVWSANGHLHQPALPAARIVDTTGAGDALMSGFLAAYWRSGDVALAARWGVANAAAVIARRGSQVGLCTVDEIEAALTEPGMTVHTRERVPGETGADVPASTGRSAEERPALAPGALRGVARLSEKSASCGRGE